MATGVRRDCSVGRSYPWLLVALLWFCGFFNYADRQAIFGVAPLIETEFRLSQAQIGLLGSAFMIVYALMSPLAGLVVDRFSRRVLIASGLAFWSIICALTGTARSFGQLLFYRGFEGLGESFYFPASMTILADYHSPKTRSRAMSIHQTSVYLGTAGGAVIAGYLGPRYGWRSPFLVLGLVGTVYAAWLYRQVVEPARGKSEPKAEVVEEIAEVPQGLGAKLAEIVNTPAAFALLLVFVGANSVASSFLTWTTKLINVRFGIDLTSSAVTSTAWPLASLFGALGGGWLADRRFGRVGGRAFLQAVALLAGAPFALACGLAPTVGLTAAALVGVGLCKGVYDANIFASLYDVVRPSLRGTAAGVMNTAGWAGASVASVAVGYAADRVGLGPAIASTSSVYLVSGLLALVASALARKAGGPRG